MTALLTDELSDCMGSAFQPATSGKKYALIAPTPRVEFCGLSLDQSTIDCYPNWGYFPGTLVRWVLCPASSAKSFFGLRLRLGAVPAVAPILAQGA
jgi:hypothetical protein